MIQRTKFPKTLLMASALIIHFSVNGQLFDYSWHKIIPSAQYEMVNFQFSGIHGDTLFLIGQTYNVDSIDLNPGIGFDWIKDENPNGTNRMVYVSKYHKTSGAYLGSKKLIEFSSSGGYVSIRGFDLDNNGQLILFGYRSNCVIDFDPSVAASGWYSSFGDGHFLAFYSSNGITNGHIEYSSNISINAISVDENNHLYWAGEIFGSEDLDFTANTDVHSSIGSSNSDAVVVNIDLTNQSYIWGKTFGGSSYDWIETMSCKNGKVILGGSFQSDTIDLNPDAGQALKFGSGLGNTATFINVLNTSGDYQNSLVFVGENSSYMYKIDTDVSGNIYCLGEVDQLDTIDMDPSTNTHYLNTLNQDPYFVAAYASDLSYKWSKTFTSPNGYHYINSLGVGDNYLALTGDVYHELLFGDDVALDTLTNYNAKNVMIIALELQTGELINHVKFPLQYNRWAEFYEPIIEPNGDLYTFGSYHDAFDFNPFDGIVNNDTTVSNFGNNYRGCILKLKWDGTVGLQENHLNKTLSVYPNPYKKQVTISFPEAMTDITLTDIHGSLMFQNQTIQNDKLTIDTEFLPAGFYFIRATTIKGVVYVSKTIKQ